MSTLLNSLTEDETCEAGRLSAIDCQLSIGEQLGVGPAADLGDANLFFCHTGPTVAAKISSISQISSSWYG